MKRKAFSRQDVYSGERLLRARPLSLSPVYWPPTAGREGRIRRTKGSAKALTRKKHHCNVEQAWKTLEVMSVLSTVVRDSARRALSCLPREQCSRLKSRRFVGQ